MRINLTSVLVDDQSKALRFCTDVLGFTKKSDVPIGEHSWLTVVSREDPDGTELLLEPSDHPAVSPFKAALGVRRHLRQSHPDRGVELSRRHPGRRTEVQKGSGDGKSNASTSFAAGRASDE